MPLHDAAGNEVSEEQGLAMVRQAEASPYVDAAGKVLTRDEAVTRARKYIVRHGQIEEIVDRYLIDLFPDEVMDWIVDPTTGRFGDD